jgi:hypothetical protein
MTLAESADENTRLNTEKVKALKRALLPNPHDEAE